MKQIYTIVKFVLILIISIPMIVFFIVRQFVSYFTSQHLSIIPNSEYQEKYNTENISVESNSPARQNKNNEMQAAVADNEEHVLQDVKLSEFRTEYLPYIEFRLGQAYGDSSKNGLGAADIFLPLWQYNNQLIFTDLRIVDRFGFSFEGNAHFGYRSFFHENKIFGGYVAFDRKKSIKTGLYFNQLTFGMEHWNKKLFIGGNIYYPIGNKNTEREYSKVYAGDMYIVPTKNANNIVVTDVYKHNFAMGEKPFPGADIEIGYELKEGLIVYLGGYYFKKAGESIVGPRSKIEYNIYPKLGQKFLRVMDAIAFEMSAQKDNTRGVIAFLGAKIRFGLPHKASRLRGIEHHMVDLVRRDIDIVTSQQETKEETKMIGKVAIIKKDIVNESELSENILSLINNGEGGDGVPIYVMYAGGIYKHSDSFDQKWEEMNKLLEKKSMYIVLAAKDVSFENNQVMFKYDEKKSGTISKTFAEFIEKRVDRVNFYGVDVVDTPWCFEQVKALEYAEISPNATSKDIIKEIDNLKKSKDNLVENRDKLQVLRQKFTRLPKDYCGDCVVMYIEKSEGRQEELIDHEQQKIGIPVKDREVEEVVYLNLLEDTNKKLNGGQEKHGNFEKPSIESNIHVEDITEESNPAITNSPPIPELSFISTKNNSDYHGSEMVIFQLEIPRKNKNLRSSLKVETKVVLCAFGDNSMNCLYDGKHHQMSSGINLSLLGYKNIKDFYTDILKSITENNSIILVNNYRWSLSKESYDKLIQTFNDKKVLYHDSFIKETAREIGNIFSGSKYIPPDETIIMNILANILPAEHKDIFMSHVRSYYNEPLAAIGNFIPRSWTSKDLLNILQHVHKEKPYDGKENNALYSWTNWALEGIFNYQRLVNGISFIAISTINPIAGLVHAASIIITQASAEWAVTNENYNWFWISKFDNKKNNVEYIYTHINAFYLGIDIAGMVLAKIPKVPLKDDVTSGINQRKPWYQETTLAIEDRKLPQVQPQIQPVLLSPEKPSSDSYIFLPDSSKDPDYLKELQAIGENITPKKQQSSEPRKKEEKENIYFASDTKKIEPPTEIPIAWYMLVGAQQFKIENVPSFGRDADPQMKAKPQKIIEPKSSKISKISEKEIPKYSALSTPHKTINESPRGSELRKRLLSVSAERKSIENNINNMINQAIYIGFTRRNVDNKNTPFARLVDMFEERINALDKVHNSNAEISKKNSLYEVLNRRSMNEYLRFHSEKMSDLLKCATENIESIENEAYKKIVALSKIKETTGESIEELTRVFDKLIKQADIPSSSQNRIQVMAEYVDGIMEEYKVINNYINGKDEQLANIIAKKPLNIEDIVKKDEQQSLNAQYLRFLIENNVITQYEEYFTNLYTKVILTIEELKGYQEEHKNENLVENKIDEEIFSKIFDIEIDIINGIRVLSQKSNIDHQWFIFFNDSFKGLQQTVYNYVYPANAINNQALLNVYTQMKKLQEKIKLFLNKSVSEKGSPIDNDKTKDILLSIDTNVQKQQKSDTKYLKVKEDKENYMSPTQKQKKSLKIQYTTSSYKKQKNDDKNMFLSPQKKTPHFVIR